MIIISAQPNRHSSGGAQTKKKKKDMQKKKQNCSILIAQAISSRLCST